MGELGNLLCLWRDLYGFRQEEAAEILRLSRQQVGKIEGGGANLSMQHLARMSDASYVPVSRMLLAFMLMDDNVDKIDCGSTELFDRLLRTIHANLSDYARNQEEDSIARQILTSPTTIEAALRDIVERSQLQPATNSSGAKPQRAERKAS